MLCLRGPSGSATEAYASTQDGGASLDARIAFESLAPTRSCWRRISKTCPSITRNWMRSLATVECTGRSACLAFPCLASPRGATASDSGARGGGCGLVLAAERHADLGLRSTRVPFRSFGFECTSFTRLQQESHRREHSNFFMGVSTLAYEANRNLMHLVAFMFLLRRRYPHVVFSLENPEATLANHPLIRHLVEQPVHEGGLGLLLTPVTYCYYDPAGPMKPSIFWNNSRQLLLEFVDISVTPWENRRRCGSDGCDCGDYGRHLQTRAGVRGNSSRQNTAMYPCGATHARTRGHTARARQPECSVNGSCP